MALSKSFNKSIYIATPSVIYNYIDDTLNPNPNPILNQPREVIGGHVAIDIAGYYFGSTEKDVTITYKNQDCLDVIFINSSYIRCSLTTSSMQADVQRSDFVLNPLDVVVRIKNRGDVTGKCGGCISSSGVVA